MRRGPRVRRDCCSWPTRCIALSAASPRADPRFCDFNRIERICRDKVTVVFNSYQFLFGFLPVVLAGTFLCARISPGAAQGWLIAASLAFYAAWNAAYLPLLLGSIVFNYGIAVGMANVESPAAR